MEHRGAWGTITRHGRCEGQSKQAGPQARFISTVSLLFRSRVYMLFHHKKCIHQSRKQTKIQKIPHVENSHIQQILHLLSSVNLSLSESP